ncbi:MAG TPA: ABC transporter permease subunit [Ktedonobacteraceae bacterium]|nr:ABC transporter permease subunit [Ktedonobacteraceae bacterium]
MGLLLITRFTFQEAIRRKIFLAAVILSAVMAGVFAILLNIAVNAQLSSGGGNLDPQLELLAVGIVISILVTWLVYLLSSLLTILMTTGMISSEVEAGTFSVIVPKPLARAEIVFGKWLGYALILSVYIALMFFTFLGIIYWQTGYWPDQPFAAFTMLELISLSLLALTTLGSSLVPTIVNGAIVLILFIGAPIASLVQFIVQTINPTNSQALQNVTTIVNLVIPTDALWHGVSYYLLPNAIGLATLNMSTNSFNTPFTSAAPIAGALLIWVILYCLTLPTLAAWRFQHRDL